MVPLYLDMLPYQVHSGQETTFIRTDLDKTESSTSGYTYLIMGRLSHHLASGYFPPISTMPGTIGHHL